MRQDKRARPGSRCKRLLKLYRSLDDSPISRSRTRKQPVHLSRSVGHEEAVLYRPSKNGVERAEELQAPGAWELLHNYRACA